MKDLITSAFPRSGSTYLNQALQLLYYSTEPVNINRHSVVAIEKAPQQPLDYSKALLEVESAAKADPEVAQAAQELATAAETNPPSNLAEILKEIKASLEKSQQSFPSNFIQNIGKAVNAAQYQNIDQQGAKINI
jgi:hypothetical protein